MLLFSMLLLGIIFLNRFQSPFSADDTLAVQTLEQKTKFTIQQKIVQPLVDTTFMKINKLSDETPQPVEENQISYDISDISNSFKNADINDARKEGYPQIAKFYTMQLEDKKWIAKKMENIKEWEKQFEDCSIGYQNKKNQLINKQNAYRSRQ